MASSDDRNIPDKLADVDGPGLDPGVARFVSRIAALVVALLAAALVAGGAGLWIWSGSLESAAGVIGARTAGVACIGIAAVTAVAGVGQLRELRQTGTPPQT